MQTEHPIESTTLARFSAAIDCSGGFTVCPGLHVLREVDMPKNPRYHVFFFMAEEGDFIWPNARDFRRIRKELYRSAVMLEPHLVGPLVTLCNTCFKPTRLKCVHCELAYYCDRVCQRAEFYAHRGFCRGSGGGEGGEPEVESKRNDDKNAQRPYFSFFFAFDLGV